MPSEGTFRFESIQDMDSILPYLEALHKGFAQGKLRLVSKDRELILEPKGLINFDVEAKRKGNRLKLQFKLTWKDEKDPDLGDETFQLEVV